METTEFFQDCLNAVENNHDAYIEVYDLSLEFKIKRNALDKLGPENEGSAFEYERLTGRKIESNASLRRKELDKEYKQKTLNVVRRHVSPAKLEQLVKKHDPKYEIGSQEITDSQIKLIERKEQSKALQEAKSEIKKQEASQENEQPTKEEQKAKIVADLKKQWGMSMEFTQELQSPGIPDNVQQILKEEENSKQELLTKQEKHAKLVEEMKRQSKEITRRLEP